MSISQNPQFYIENCSFLLCIVQIFELHEKELKNWDCLYVTISYGRISHMDNQFKNEYIKARYEYIRKDFPGLNPEQQEAVLATEGPLLILAGAGSGKTTVLINRIANLIKYGKASDCDLLPPCADEEHLHDLKTGGPLAEEAAAFEKVDPWRILAITFTNKAAAELRERLERKLGEDASDIWACTFHSACVRILRKDADYIGFPSNFTIYDTTDSVSVLKKIIKDMNLDDKTFAPKAVLAEISRAKDSFKNADAYEKAASSSIDFRKGKIAQIYREYSRQLFASGALDFDDIIYFTVKLLQDFPERREFWQRRFKYILIDEYQDTNHLQYLLASLLTGPDRNICVVGDDDQSIYRFRGANIENILSFEDEYRGCRTIRLEQNYRSTENILSAANSVIANNRGRKGKTLWTANGKGSPIGLFVAENQDDEARFVADSIVKDYAVSGSWKRNVILYRMNAQSNQFEYAFKRAGIPYRIIGGTRYFDRAEVKDILSYLNVINSTADDLRLLRIINNPPRGIGPKSVETATSIAANEGKSVFEILKNADAYPDLSRSAIRMRQFASLIEELRSYSDIHTPDELLDELYAKTGYIQMLREKDTLEDEARIENVEELKTSVIQYMKESGDNTLAGFLADVALYSDLDNYDKNADCAVMMTMHSAKGLEFPNVFIVGMEETIFPGAKCIGDNEEMEEERRLCYVAITRAMNQLSLVCAKQRMLFGRTSANKISRFIEEIPDELVNKRNVPRSYRFSPEASRPSNSYASFGGDSYDRYSGRNDSYSSYDSYTRPRAQERKYTAVPAVKKAETPPPSFSVGDRVKHKAFGEGTLSKMTPMGGDFLIEIAFDSIGTKKLMLRAAAMFMEKIS